MMAVKMLFTSRLSRQKQGTILLKLAYVRLKLMK